MTDLAHSLVCATAFFARRIQVGTFAALLVSIAGGLDRRQLSESADLLR